MVATTSAVDFYANNFRPLFLNPEVALESGHTLTVDQEDKLELVVTPKSVPSIQMKTFFEELSKFLKIPFDNYGNITYNDKMQLTYYGQPQFQKEKGADGQSTIHLTIGATRKGTDENGAEYNYTQVAIPVIWNEKESDYYVGGHLISCEIIKGKAELNIPDTAMLKIEQKKGHRFFFPIRTDKETTAQQIRDAFNAGRLDEVVTGNNAAWFKATTLLAPTVKANKFPAEGVMIVVKGGKLKSTPWGEQTIRNVTFDVVSVSHPELQTQNSVKKGETALMFTLADVTNISFNEGSKPYQYFDEGMANASDTLYIHFQEPAIDRSGKVNPDYTPPLTCSKGDRTMSATGKKLFAAYKQGAFAGAPSKQSLSPSATSADPAEPSPEVLAKLDF